MRMSLCSSSILGRTRRLVSMGWDLNFWRKKLWVLESLSWKERIGGSRLRLMRKPVYRNFSNSRRSQCECAVGFQGKPFQNLGMLFSMRLWGVSPLRITSRYSIISTSLFLITSKTWIIFPSHFCCCIHWKIAFIRLGGNIRRVKPFTSSIRGSWKNCISTILPEIHRS